MESFKVNDAVEVIDQETGRWTAAVITSFAENNVLVRYPGWPRDWSSGELNIADVRQPTVIKPSKRLRSRLHFSPWEAEPTNTVNLSKLERGDTVYIQSEENPVAEVCIVDPFQKKVTVKLQDGPSKTVAADALLSVFPSPILPQIAAKTQKRSRKSFAALPMSPSPVPPQKKLKKASISDKADQIAETATTRPVEPPTLPPAELDLVYTILDSGLVIRCGEAYLGSGFDLLVTRIVIRPSSDGLFVCGRKFANDSLRVSNDFIEVTADELSRSKPFKCDATRMIKLEAIRRTQLSTSRMNLIHLRLQRKNELGSLLRTQVRSLMTSKCRSGYFCLPFSMAFDSELLHLDTAFGLKTELIIEEFHLLDKLAGKGWDYKPIDAKEESPGFFYFVKRMAISVDLASLMLKFAVSYTKSQFNWTNNYRSDCRNQLKE